MISMLCQKSNFGVISQNDKVLFDYVLCDEADVKFTTKKSNDIKSYYVQHNSSTTSRISSSLTPTNTTQPSQAPSSSSSSSSSSATSNSKYFNAPPSSYNLNSNNSHRSFDTNKLKTPHNISNTNHELSGGFTGYKKAKDTNNFIKFKNSKARSQNSTISIKSVLSSKDISILNPSGTLTPPSSSTAQADTKLTLTDQKTYKSVNNLTTSDEKASKPNVTVTKSILKQQPAILPLPLVEAAQTVTAPAASSTTFLNFSNARMSPKKLKNLEKFIDDQQSYELYKRIKSLQVEKQKIIENADKNIEQEEWLRNRKRELIYKNWYLNVYEPIKNEIHKEMESFSDQVRNNRSIKYLEYLNQINKYGHVFREDFEPMDYNPTGDGMLNLDANLSVKLKDPTMLSKRKNFNEETTMFKCMTGFDLTPEQAEKIKLPIIRNGDDSRVNINWSHWLMEEHNTIESNARIKSAKKCNPARHSSEFNINPNRMVTFDV